MDLKVIRALDLDVLKRICKVRNDVFVVEKGVPEDIESDSFDVIDGQCDHFLLVSSEDTGAARVKRVDDSIVLQRFCVYNKYRKCGYGRYLIKYIEDYYTNLGYKSVSLDAKCHAAGFYEACGYSIVSEPFIEADVLHVKMLKNL